MLDKASPLGNLYEAKKNDSRFFKHAVYYSVDQVLEWLKILEFDHIQVFQTIFRKPEEITALEPIRGGHGKGFFAVISAERSVVPGQEKSLRKC